MAKLNIVHRTTGEEFETEGDFTVVTPRILIQNMKDYHYLHTSDTYTSVHKEKGNLNFEQDTTLDKLGFKDGDTI